MTDVIEPYESFEKLPRLSGFLLDPFGWLRELFAVAVELEPDLLRDICSLDCKRMHLIALAMAHLDGSREPVTTRFLLRGRTGEILDRALGHRPRGLHRALSKLNKVVLRPEGYHRLVNLLDDPDGFKFLAHADYIDEEDLEDLANIPVPLRPLLAPFMGATGIRRLSGFVHGLRFLVARGAAPSFEALMAELKLIRQPLQLCAHVKRLVDALSLPTELPPPQIGPARRLDNTAEIRELAKRWRNCLGDAYLWKIDKGTCAIYLWDVPEAPAVCSVERCGRLGWFLEGVKGPRNTSLPDQQLSCIQQAFADAGIPQDDVAQSIQAFTDLNEDGLRRHRRIRS